MRLLVFLVVEEEAALVEGQVSLCEGLDTPVRKEVKYAKYSFVALSVMVMLDDDDSTSMMVRDCMRRWNR